MNWSCLAAAALACAIASPVGAVTVTWNGGGAGDGWASIVTTPGAAFGQSNWGGAFVLPAPGDHLVFDGTRRLVNHNDLKALGWVRSLTFAEGAGAFTLSGTGFTLAGNLSNLSAQRQTIALPITVSAPESFWDGGSAGVAVHGALTLGNNTLFLQRHVAVDNGAYTLIGSGGSATLVVGGGSTVGLGWGLLGHGAGDSGTVSVQDAGSRLSTRGSLDVGNAGSGALYIGHGATGHFGALTLGYGSGARGVVTVTRGSSLTVTSYFNIGGTGVGTVTVDSGSSFDGVHVAVGNYAGSVGHLTIGGQGTRWTASGFEVGAGGSGNVDINAGAVVHTRGNSAIGIFGSGNVGISGVGTRWDNDGVLWVGQRGPGTLTVRDGAVLVSGETVLGFLGGSRGDVLVTGAGALMQTSSLSVGSQGQGRLRIEAGGLVAAPTLAIGAGGLLELAGGTLATASFNAAGRFDWTAGTLRVTGPQGIALGGGVLSPWQVLAPGMTLDVSGTLNVGAGTALLLAGGELRSGTIALAGGTLLATTGRIDLDQAGNLRGGGNVVGALRGGADRRIVADGTLTLGDAARSDGFVFEGRLDVGKHQVVALAAGKAMLGTSTTLDNDGVLAAVNGWHLQPGRTLDSMGNTRIFGSFINDGSVGSAGGTLAFMNDVSGDGSFDGDVAFRAAYAPGHSPAAIHFGNGVASFEAGSLLTLDVSGATPGLQHDQLKGAGALVFHGRLKLVFEAGYTPRPGEQLVLFDFGSFAGAISGDRIDVVGIDRSALDLSRLLVDGTVAVSAVPEPASALLALAGLALLGLRAARRY